MTGRAKFIVEGLRSGVPYRDLAKTVAFGRERYIDSVKRMMEGVEQGRAPKLPSLVLRANYGEGKTHLLHSLWGAGEDRNWVVSFVSLSKETPLDRLDYLYPKLMGNTYIPGSAQPGVAFIVARALENQLLLPEARTMGMSSRIMAVLDALVVHDEGYDELLADVAGDFLSMSDLKRIYRQNLGRAPQLTRSIMKDEAFEYMRLIDWLIQKAGFAGWLILVDEVELVGKSGKGARSQAYANMGRLIEGKLPHTLSVWALAANFLSDVLIRRNDREECPRWLSARQKEEERAPWSEAALDALLEAKLLDPLTVTQIKALVQQIHELHQEAYAWSAPFDGEDLYEQVRRFAPTQDTRLRTYVRLSLAILDVWYQHGEPPVIEYLDPLQDAALDEQPERNMAGGVGDDGQKDGGDGEADETNSEPGKPNMITRRLIFHD
ncbi:MAG: BREX system ATP-binding domain-containing protein [Bacilli bacterium]